MISDFHFIRPEFLLAFIPLGIIILFWIKHHAKFNWNQICDAELLPFLIEESTANNSRWGVVSGVIASFLTILALAGPTWERLPTPVFRNDTGLVIILDLSKSMLAEDLTPSRLIRAHYKITDILKQRKDGQTALIVYAGDAFTATPLTEDTNTILNQLNVLKPNIMPLSGSNLSAAIQQAVDLFKHSSLHTGHILLVTDGVDLDSHLKSVSALESYKLSVLAVGTSTGAPIKLSQGNFLKDRAGNIIIPKLEIHNLQIVAQTGNGILQTITSDNSDIKTILKFVDHSPTDSVANEKNNLLLDQWDDKGAWLIVLILPLVLFNFKRGLLIWVFIVLIPIPKNSYALEWNDLWQTQDQQAQQEFENQAYKKAAEKFEDLNWKAAAQYKAGEYVQAVETLQTTDTADGLYNKANALAKSGQLDAALEAYQQALKLNPNDPNDPNDADIKHNYNLVEEALKKQQQEKEQQSKDGEKSKDNKDQQDSDKNSKSDENKESQSEADNKSDDSDQVEQSKDSNNPEDLEPKESESKDNKSDEEAKKNEPQKTQAELKDQESKQADAQWLNRIVDDPSALLKRKFQDEYNKRRTRQQ